MADAIVQTIKIEVDGADQAAAEIKKVGQATEEVQATAARTAGGTAELGKGLDEVSQKSGVSSRELRSLSKIAKEFGADTAVVGLSLVRMAAVLGPIGAAVFALGEAFSFVKGKMKEMEEAAKATVATMATLAQKSADANLEKEAVFWGMKTAELKKFNAEADNTVEKMERIQKGSKEVITADTAGQEKAFITLLERHGIVINDVMADEGKLGKAFYQTGIEAARLFKNLSPIERLNLEKVLKGLGFTDAQIKSMEKGEEAFKKAYDAAVKQKEITDQLAASWDRLNKLFLATSLGPPPVEDWSNFTKVLGGISDVIDSVIGFFARMPPAVDASIALAKAAIDAWVTTPVANAWQWIKDVWNDIGTWFGTKIEEIRQLVTAWVTTPIANAWQWIKDTWNANVPKFAQIGGAAAGGQVGATPGLAGGGLLGGRGTGTSDSNLAWVSRGEFITPARAVSQPGVLAFLEALRLSGGNLRGMLNSMGHFALGGMVAPRLSIPAFAGGGMNNITINFPGLPEITGLRASSSVVDELRNAAAMAQVRSGGRKPSRYS